jgi:hypothetical protein
MPRNDKQLNEIPSGKIKMGREFFKNVRDRIETIRPEAGDYIRVEPQKGYGLKISGNFEIVTLNVCVNGTPGTLDVLSPITTT